MKLSHFNENCVKGRTEECTLYTFGDFRELIVHVL
jgi:hypothetical protein